MKVILNYSFPSWSLSLETVNNVIEIMDEFFLFAIMIMLFSLNSGSAWTQTAQDSFLTILNINSILIVLINLGKQHQIIYFWPIFIVALVITIIEKWRKKKPKKNDSSISPSSNSKEEGVVKVETNRQISIKPNVSLVLVYYLGGIKSFFNRR